MLFSLVNIARWEGINPDDALENANKKFRNRFEFIEAKAKKMGVSLNEMSLKEMDKLWEEAKGD